MPFAEVICGLGLPSLPTGGFAELALPTGIAGFLGSSSWAATATALFGESCFPVSLAAAGIPATLEAEAVGTLEDADTRGKLEDVTILESALVGEGAFD